MFGTASADQLSEYPKREVSDPIDELPRRAAAPHPLGWCGLHLNLWRDARTNLLVDGDAYTDLDLNCQTQGKPNLLGQLTGIRGTIHLALKLRTVDVSERVFAFKNLVLQRASLRSLIVNAVRALHREFSLRWC